MFICGCQIFPDGNTVLGIWSRVNAAWPKSAMKRCSNTSRQRHSMSSGPLWSRVLTRDQEEGPDPPCYGDEGAQVGLSRLDHVMDEDV